MARVRRVRKNYAALLARYRQGEKLMRPVGRLRVSRNRTAEDPGCLSVLSRSGGIGVRESAHRLAHRVVLPLGLAAPSCSTSRLASRRLAIATTSGVT